MPGTETIEFPEFLIMMARTLKGSETAEDIRQAFKLFDRDHNGTISSAELRHVITHFGEKLSSREIEEIMQEVEADANGFVNYEGNAD